MRRLNWAQVRARRLERQSLAQRAPAERVVELVRATCGLHAQVMAAAGISLAVRVDGITSSDLDDALWRDRALVKAWTIRGTLHLHPADELPLWYAARRAVASDTHDGLPAWRDPGGVEHPPLAADDVEAVRAAVRDALDGACLLREELADEVARRVERAPRERLRSGFSFFLDEICQGPPRGTKVTFVLPEQWVEGWHEVDETEALRSVCRRYLRTYGPARPEDFREWFGGGALTPAAARRLFDSLAAELEKIDVEGHHAFVLAADATFDAAVSSTRLLPEYDVYVMGFRERQHLVPDDVKAEVARHGRGRYEGPAGVRFLTTDGVAAGLWERKRRGRRLDVSVSTGSRLTAARRSEVEREAHRIASFLGFEPVVTIADGRRRASTGPAERK